MARIEIRHHYADGEMTEVIASGRNPSPDAFETMCRQAFDKFTDAVAYMLAIEAVGDE